MVTTKYPNICTHAFSLPQMIEDMIILGLFYINFTAYNTNAIALLRWVDGWMDEWMDDGWTE